LKDCFNLAFDDKLTVFLSSDPEDLPASEEWLEGIRRALEQCSILITLVSPACIVGIARDCFDYGIVYNAACPALGLG
jgi:hypothetical protein